MGPIRAFIRPSHAAAPDHSATTASLFCPTQSFPTQHHHRPCCAHVTPSFAPQHQHHPSRYPLYAAAATSDPLRVGLVSSSPQPCLYHHFKKLLPPGAPLGGPLPVLTALSQAQGEGARAEVDREGKGRCKWGGGRREGDWGGIETDEGNWTKDKEEYSETKISGEFKPKRDCGHSKWKTSSAIYNGSKLNSNGHGSQWNKSQEDSESKEREEGNKSKKNNIREDATGKREKATPVTACLSSSLTKHDEPLPSTSRVALLFPFSEDEEDDDEEEDDCNEGAVPGGESRRVTWRISDIVETEDEEGETLLNEKESEGVKEEGQYACAKEKRKDVEKTEIQIGKCSGNEGERKEKKEEGEEEEEEEEEEKYEDDEAKDNVRGNEKEQPDLNDSSRGINHHLVSFVIKHPHIRVPEGTLNVSVPEIGKEQKNEGDRNSGNSSHLNGDNDSTQVIQFERDSEVEVHRQSVNKECGIEPRADKEAEDNEREEEEEEEEEEGEEEEEMGDGDPQKDGIRSTQRLRPSSYRQFLLTRERRSRVFLKERSYHLGRWFVTHFTHPYPSKEQKDVLAARTKMTRNQVSEWFGNMRRRIREATRGRGICWEERVRIYNSVITGKSEPLPILPEDDINTWVPPVSNDLPAADAHEEVSASPKFKTTLLHRYLNNSDAGDFSVGDGCAETSDSMVTPAGFASTNHASTPGGELPRHYQEGPSCSSNVIEVPNTNFPNGPFPHIFPLCTSSPKENIKELWNNSFEHVKDNYMPSINHRNALKEQKARPGNANSPDDNRKVARRLEISLQTDPNAVGPQAAKKPRITMAPSGDWFQRPSTSKFSSDEVSGFTNMEAERGRAYSKAQVVSGPKVPVPCWSVRRPVIEHSRSSEDPAVGDGHLRQPEELAAAYTLMQLQHM